MWRARPSRCQPPVLVDGIIARFLYLEGSYESHLLDLIGALPLQGTTCLDIGGNIGLHALVLGGQVGPNGRVYSFEPERHNHELLDYNLRLNGLSNVYSVK